MFEENTRMKKFKSYIMCLTLALMTVVLCSCNKQKDKITLSDSTLDKISELEDKYGVTINYCNVPVDDNIKFEYKIADDADEIAEAVEAAEVIFSRLPDDWAEYLMNPAVDMGMSEKITKVNVVFCNEIECEEDAYGTEMSFGMQYTCSEDTLYLLADIHNFEARKSISDTIVNRTLGLIEYEDELTELLKKDQPGLDEKTEQILFRQYEKCNPENFEYYGYVSEVEDDYKKYIYSEDADVENVYFINEESMYSGDLDCINIMGPLLYTDENEKLPEAFNSPHIQEKVLYTIDRFDMIFWQQGYWSRWFE